MSAAQWGNRLLAQNSISKCLFPFKAMKIFSLLHSVETNLSILGKKRQLEKYDYFSLIEPQTARILCLLDYIRGKVAFHENL